VKGAYRVALLCGTVPLVVGLSVFLLWLLTRADGLMLLGVFVLFGGLAFFAVGVLALGRYCWLAFRESRLPARFWAATIACALLLLSNFPAAGAIMYAADALHSRYTVVVRNESGRPLEDVRVTGGGCEVVFGLIAPGDDEQRSFWIQHDGVLRIRADGLAEQPISGYVTNGMGGRTTVTVRADGTVAAVDRD
jgi:hypothetical protein